jgi:hypothetical protein
MRYRFKPAMSVLCLLVLLLNSSFLLTNSYTQALDENPRPTLKVLFIGNSYTFYNNLGDITAGIADSQQKGPLIAPTLVVHAGFTLRDHLENGDALAALDSGEWDYVVFQEQSMLGGAMIDGQLVFGDPAVFQNAAGELIQHIRLRHATPILFMTWAQRYRPHDINTLAKAYLEVGEQYQVKVAPVGTAWAQAQKELPEIRLHISDNTHPAPAGSYLAACVIYGAITGHAPEDAPNLIEGHPYSRRDGIRDPSHTVPLVDLSPETADKLQKIARRTVVADH